MLVYIHALSSLRRRIVRYSRPRGGPGGEDVSSRGGRKALRDAWGSTRLVAIADTFCRGRNGAEQVAGTQATRAIYPVCGDPI
jgi:hypothetical protein